MGDGNKIGPIAAKLVGQIERARRGQLATLRDFLAGRDAKELQKELISKDKLAGYHPAHAPHLYAQNYMSLMSEQLSTLKEMTPIVDILSEAEDNYMPDGPPMSPLTRSYFTCWAFFDACYGPGKETVGTIVLELGAAFGMDGRLWLLIESMQDSRMGIYIHQGTEGDLVILEDIVTGSTCRAISPAGYLGKKGELWYVRVLPPIGGSSVHVAFTTPYLLLQPGARDWLAYFKRTLAQDPKARVADYLDHMKYGPTRVYWSEFVFEAYVNHKFNVIYLTGLPDVPESRPHSSKGRASGW